MYGITDLKTGTKFLFNGEPQEVLSYQHSKTGRAGGVMRTRIKNLITGAITERTFHGNDQFEPADVSSAKAQYLYNDGENYNFMEMSSYEQFSVGKKLLGDKVNYLKEGIEVQILQYEGRTIDISLPIKMSFAVIETSPGVRGDTAQGGSKPAKIETGATVTVPLFINQGDKIVVDTRDGHYVERSVN